MDARIQAWIDQDDANTTAIIRRHGWMVRYVGGGACNVPGCEGDDNDDQPSFAYTVGMFGLGHPELLIFDVSPSTATGVLNELGERIREGDTLIPGRPITFDQWGHRVVLEEVPNPGEIVFSANRFYRRPADHSVDVLQVTYDDNKGLFPWDDGYVAVGNQPRPGSFTA